MPRMLSAVLPSDPRPFYEMYGTGNIVQAASTNVRNLNIKGLGAFDLRTCRPDGKPWDFTKRSHRKLAYRTVKDTNPDWLVGSPPCTPFCTWNTGINKNKGDPAKREARLAEGRAHLRFVIPLYHLQLQRGKHFLHEHPAGQLPGRNLPWCSPWPARTRGL